MRWSNLTRGWEVCNEVEVPRHDKTHRSFNFLVACVWSTVLQGQDTEPLSPQLLDFAKLHLYLTPWSSFWKERKKKKCKKASSLWKRPVTGSLYVQELNLIVTVFFPCCLNPPAITRDVHSNRTDEHHTHVHYIVALRGSLTRSSLMIITNSMAYGTRMFNASFIRTLQLSLSWAKST